MTSRGLQILQQAHRELFNKEPRVYTIHAGLECGMLTRGWLEVPLVALKG
jgi:di/tripeptidase